VAARFTAYVFTSFPGTPLPHAICIGLPLRRSIVELDRVADHAAATKSFGLRAELPTLLVSGGSQGALRINTAVTDAREHLLGRGIQVLHVLGPKNMDDRHVAVTDPVTGAVYRPVAFVAQMEQAYAAADLMLGRCGASTVLETATVGLPAIFVPYPHGNGEQGRNAALVVAAGGGELRDDADCTADWVGRRVPELIADVEKLAGMSRAARGVAMSDAAVRLARNTLEVAG
jgi:UDP-N-acetylglucosamine--N-acetylmuramyl-(pentapeptide) pyrophosphoryl-undecaprenol N-acetylglucosamine transferase